VTYNPIEIDDPWRGLWLVVLAWATPIVLIVLRRALEETQPAWRAIRFVIVLTVSIALGITLRWLGFALPVALEPVSLVMLVLALAASVASVVAIRIWRARQRS
jgi:hypothetical protein